MSTWYFLHRWFGDRWPAGGRRGGLWTTLALLGLVGALAAARRYRRAVRTNHGATLHTGARGDWLGTRLMTATGAGLLAFAAGTAATCCTARGSKWAAAGTARRRWAYAIAARGPDAAGGPVRRDGVLWALAAGAAASRSWRWPGGTERLPERNDQSAGVEGGHP